MLGAEEGRVHALALSENGTGTSSPCKSLAVNRFLLSILPRREARVVGQAMWEQWESLRSRLRSPQHTHSLLLAVLWPLVVLIIAVLALRLVTSAKDLADLISATASLLWPIIAFTVITWFRPELRALLARIRKGKFLGQEIELDELEARTEAAEATAETIAAGAGSADGLVRRRRTEGYQ